MVASGRDYVVIYPNNDHGTDTILEEYERLRGNPHVRLYPSIRFEFFLRILKDAQFVVGNSSAGVREAPHFGIPAINIGSRQNNRVQHEAVINVPPEASAIGAAIEKAAGTRHQPATLLARATAPKCSTPFSRTPNSGSSRHRSFLSTGSCNEGDRPP